jgi:hypothetical protein
MVPVGVQVVDVVCGVVEVGTRVVVGTSRGVVAGSFVVAGTLVGALVVDVATNGMSTGVFGSVNPLLFAIVVPRGESQFPDLTIHSVEPPGTTPNPKLTIPPDPEMLLARTTQAARRPSIMMVVVAADVWAELGAMIRSTGTPVIPVSMLGSKTPFPAASLKMRAVRLLG